MKYLITLMLLLTCSMSYAQSNKFFDNAKNISVEYLDAPVRLVIEQMMKQGDVKNYLIDIDGTICDDIPNEQPERMATAAVYPEALVSLNKWYGEGHIITFFTSRTEEHRAVTEKWLADHGLTGACGLQPALLGGINVMKGMITHRAVAEAQQAVRLLPRVAAAHRLLGAALQAAGRPEDAAVAMAEAARLELPETEAPPAGRGGR